MTSSAILSFHDAVRTRHSTRGFLADPIPRDVLKIILDEAQRAPSNCNTQPWSMHIVSGPKLSDLSAALVEAMRSETYSLNFSFDRQVYPEPYRSRASAQGRTYYQALGVARDDALSRAEIVERNVHFFGAPHAALLFMPSVGDDVRMAADVGMYGQTFLLSLAARGYAGVPQAVLSYFADTIRDVLEISGNLKLLFGISFGKPDMAHPVFSYRVGRVDIAESVVWHE